MYVTSGLSLSFQFQEDKTVTGELCWAENWEQLRDSGRYAVITPAECIALAKRDGQLMLHPLMGVIPPELAWQSLRLYESEVLPKLDAPAP